MSEDILFEELKSVLLTQKRLLKRFYDFCLSYQDFEFDEMGLNIDEAENEKRKALKIKDKILNEITQNTTYLIKEDSTDILKNTIILILEYNINESKKTVKFLLIVENDGFTLEVSK